MPDRAKYKRYLIATYHKYNKSYKAIHKMTYVFTYLTVKYKILRVNLAGGFC